MEFEWHPCTPALKALIKDAFINPWQNFEPKKKNGLQLTFINNSSIFHFFVLKFSEVGYFAHTNLPVKKINEILLFRAFFFGKSVSWTLLYPG